MGSGSRTAISVPDLIDLQEEIASGPLHLPGEPFRRPLLLGGPPSLVFGVELGGLLEDPIASVGMISWFIGVAVNLAGSVQYPV